MTRNKTVNPFASSSQGRSGGASINLNLSIKMTEQKYAPVRDSTTLSEQTAIKSQLTAQNEAQSPPAVDNRRFNPSNPRVNLIAVQKDLLELVQSYADTISPVPLINELLITWTIQPFVDLGSQNPGSQLRKLLELTSFLVELKETYQTYEFFLDKCLQEEVSHE